MQLTAEQKTKLELEQQAKLKQKPKAASTEPSESPKAKRAKVSKSEALATTKVSLSAPIELKAATLANVQAQMDSFAEDFSDEVAETIEDGLIYAIELTGQKVRSLGVTDFFGDMGKSLYASSAPQLDQQMKPSLLPSVDGPTIDTTAKQLD